MTSTREKILLESLNLFSVKGYNGVSMRDIAAAVGIKAASIYNHFKGKEAIFDALLEEMNIRYMKEAEKMQINGSNPDEDVAVYKNISIEMLTQIGKELFCYFLHDEYTAKFRRMLTIEQYQNEKLAAYYTKQYWEEPLQYQEALFGMLIKAGVFREADSDIMAAEFYAPIYLFLTICDRQPEYEPKILEMLERHIRQFAALYAKGEAEK